MPATPLDPPVPASAEPLVICGIGARVLLRVDGPLAGPLLEWLRVAWTRCLGGTDGPIGEPVTVHTRAGEEPDDLLAGITQQVTHALIGAQTGRLLMFHAGAVCHPVTGRSLVYVAAGGTGKTTLTRTLGTGYGYLTDETVAIDTAHRVLPYAKPLSTRRTGPGPKHEVCPDDLGLLPAVAEPTVARVVLLDRDDRFGDEPEVDEVGLLDALTELGPQSSALYALTGGLHRCADLIEATGPVLRVRYAEAETLRPLAADLIGEPS